MKQSRCSYPSPLPRDGHSLLCADRPGTMLLQAPAVLLLAVLFGSTNGLRILVSNDDSWASANVRMLYQALRNAHHDVVLAAPARQQSGRGALRESVQPLGDNSAFGLLKKGTAGLGCDPNDGGWCGERGGKGVK